MAVQNKNVFNKVRTSYMKEVNKAIQEVTLRGTGDVKQSDWVERSVNIPADWVLSEATITCASALKIHNHYEGLPDLDSWGLVRIIDSQSDYLIENLINDDHLKGGLRLTVCVNFSEKNDDIPKQYNIVLTYLDVFNEHGDFRIDLKNTMRRTKKVCENQLKEVVHPSCYADIKGTIDAFERDFQSFSSLRQPITKINTSVVGLDMSLRGGNKTVVLETMSDNYLKWKYISNELRTAFESGFREIYCINKSMSGVLDEIKDACVKMEKIEGMRCEIKPEDSEADELLRIREVLIESSAELLLLAHQIDEKSGL